MYRFRRAVNYSVADSSYLGRHRVGRTLTETPEQASEMPLEQIPALVAEVASEQAAVSATQDVLTARLLVTPPAHDSVTDSNRLLTAKKSRISSA